MTRSRTIILTIAVAVAVAAAATAVAIALDHDDSRPMRVAAVQPGEQGAGQPGLGQGPYGPGDAPRPGVQQAGPGGMHGGFADDGRVDGSLLALVLVGMLSTGAAVGIMALWRPWRPTALAVSPAPQTADPAPEPMRQAAVTIPMSVAPAQAADAVAAEAAPVESEVVREVAPPAGDTPATDPESPSPKQA